MTKKSASRKSKVTPQKSNQMDFKPMLILLGLLIFVLLVNTLINGTGFSALGQATGVINPDTTEVSSQVQASSDDAYNDPICCWPGYSHTSTVVFAGNAGSTGPTYGGFRFTGLKIPGNAQIVSAHVEFTQNAWGWTMPTQLAFQDSSAPQTFSSSNPPSSRGLTTFKTEWNWPKAGPDSVLKTPDLSDGIQELIDSYGTLNSVVLIEQGLESNAQGRSHNWYSYDNDPSKAAKLVVEYTLPETQSAPIPHDETKPIFPGQSFNVFRNGEYYDTYTYVSSINYNTQDLGDQLNVNYTFRNSAGQNVAVQNRNTYMIDGGHVYLTVPTLLKIYPVGVTTQSNFPILVDADGSRLLEGFTQIYEPVMEDDIFMLTERFVPPGTEPAYYRARIKAILEYAGSDDDSRSNPQINFKDVVSGETISRAASFEDGKPVTTIKFAGRDYFVWSDSDTSQADFYLAINNAVWEKYPVRQPRVNLCEQTLYRIEKALGSSCGEANYDLGADVNRDNVVSAADASIVASQGHGACEQSINLLAAENHDCPVQLAPSCQEQASRVQAAYGASCGDANYDHTVDRDSNGVINGADSSLIVANGQSESTCAAWNLVPESNSVCPSTTCQQLLDLAKDTFGGSCENEEWDTRSDINNDYVISSEDVSLIIANKRNETWCQTQLQAAGQASICRIDRCEEAVDRYKAAYGSTCGDANYDPLIDVNKDKFVSPADFSKLLTDDANGYACSLLLANTYDPCA